jgi:hypothetical protein
LCEAKGFGNSRASELRIATRCAGLGVGWISAVGWRCERKSRKTFCVFWTILRLTPRWSQRRPALEFMDGLGYTTIIEIAEPLARRRGSALDR